MEDYRGFEIGPIRPPSEARSLLLRVTRNCPWNQCHFCTLYKGEKFSLRPKEDVIQEIHLLRKVVDRIFLWRKQGVLSEQEMTQELIREFGVENEWAFYSAFQWMEEGFQSVFLQDANTLILRPESLKEILEELRQAFPQVQRVTSYARSHTISRISQEQLDALAQAGLNRIHIGMETGSTQVLRLVQKGVDKETHILAGQRVKQAGIQLSLYYMPGLGGLEYLKESAEDTADCVNAVDPDFLRIRTLAVQSHSPLARDYQDGVFTFAGDTKNVEELLLFVENLKGITTHIKSDHVLNLLPEVNGKLPERKEKILRVMRDYLALSTREQNVFRFGRRWGLVQNLSHWKKPGVAQQIEEIMKAQGVNDDNIDELIPVQMTRFI